MKQKPFGQVRLSVTIVSSGTAQLEEKIMYDVFFGRLWAYGTLQVLEIFQLQKLSVRTIDCVMKLNL